MHFIKSMSVAAAAFVSLASSMPLVEKRDVVTVTLAQVDNSVIKATLTNTGTSDVSLLKYGTILDDSTMTRKVHIAKDGAEVPFEGIHKSYLLTSLPASAFTTVAAGSILTKTIDLAIVHDLSSGGTFSVASVGTVPVASAGSTQLSNLTLTFESNVLDIEIDGAKAAQVERAVHTLQKRTSVASGCTSAQSTALKAALGHAVSLGNAAASAATGGSATKFSEYYKTTVASVRSTVAGRFKGVVTQSSSTSGGGTTYYCYDAYGDCSSGVLAYTLPSANTIANCPLYYSALPSLSSTCHAQDQTTTSMHEFTHAPATYSPGTADNAYGYSASVALTSARAVLNADTYALYANAIYVGC